MTRFENKICPACRAPFTADADIVVCPVCGTPHHRTCYLAAGKCALEELHETGYVWNGRLPDETEPEPEPAPEPENTDPHHAEYPNVPPLGDIEDIESLSDLQAQRERILEEFANAAKDSEIGEDGVSMQELIAYSATSIFHYGNAFSAFRGEADGKKHKVFFNACSGIFAPVFQFYRKMDVFGVAVLLLTMLPMFISMLIYITSGEGANNDFIYRLLELVYLAEVVLLCIFGDYIYYKHAVKGIIKIRGEFKDKEKSGEYFMELFNRGKPSFARAFIGILAESFVWACIAALPDIIKNMG